MAATTVVILYSQSQNPIFSCLIYSLHPGQCYVYVCMNRSYSRYIRLDDEQEICRYQHGLTAFLPDLSDRSEPSVSLTVRRPVESDPTPGRTRASHCSQVEDNIPVQSRRDTDVPSHLRSKIASGSATAPVRRIRQCASTARCCLCTRPPVPGAARGTCRLAALYRRCCLRLGGHSPLARDRERQCIHTTAICRCYSSTLRRPNKGEILTPRCPTSCRPPSRSDTALAADPPAW